MWTMLIISFFLVEDLSAPPTSIDDVTSVPAAAMLVFFFSVLLTTFDDFLSRSLLASALSGFLDDPSDSA